MFEHIGRVAPTLRRFGLVRPGLANGLAFRTGVEAIEADLTEAAEVRAAVAEARPERIIHLAAHSSVHASWSDPAACFATNVLGLGHLLDALREASLSPRVLVVGSADEYGAVGPQDLPLGEDAPLRPRSPYAASKVASRLPGALPCAGPSTSMSSARGRSRTPGRVGASCSPRARSRDRSRKSKRGRCRRSSERATSTPCATSRTSGTSCGAYWSLLEGGEPGGTYNVCSGHGVSLHELLDTLLELSGAAVDRVVDPSRLRPSDVPALVGDPAKLREATGWRPEIPLKQTLRDLLEHWRGRVRGAAAG